MINNIKFIAIAGDSGGHIFPAIKFINELSNIKDPNCILFITNETGIKFIDNINNKDINVCVIKSKNKIKIILKIIVYLTPIFLKNKKIKLIGFGSFITTPVLFLSKLFNIFLKNNKIFIHEQNYIFGLANKINCKIADKIFTSFPSKSLKKKEIYVGNFFYDLKKDIKKLDHNMINILLLGGSGGSVELNEILISKLKKLNKESLANLNLHLQIAPSHLETYKDKYSRLIKNSKFFSFDNAIDFSSYDLIISRSGSGSLNDILFFNSSVFFVPHLHSRDNHQFLNLNFFKRYIHLLENLNIPKNKITKNPYYFCPLINPYSINKIICYITR